MATTGYAIPTGGQMQPIIDMLEDTLFRHPNWTKVATVNSPGGMPCSVWKCSSAANSIGVDWHLLIARTTVSPSTMYLGVAEGYNADTQKVTRPVPGTAATVTVPSPDGSYLGGNECSIWGASGSTLNTTDILFHGIGTANASQSYCVVTNNWIGAPFFSSSTSSTMFWAGGIKCLFDPSKFTVVCSSGAADTSAGLTRHHKMVSRHASAWRACGPCMPWTPTSGTVNGSGDRFFDNLPVGARCRLTVGASEGTQEYITGKVLGLYPDMYRFNMASDMYYGDTITIGGHKYMYCGTAYAVIDTDVP